MIRRPGGRPRAGWPHSWSHRRTGGRVTYIADDYHVIKIKVLRNWQTRNYVGTIFGGSMFAATDPIYMLMLINILGKDFVVWDKAGNIKFLRPGKSTLTAQFMLTPELIEQIRSEVEGLGEKDYVLDVELKDTNSKVVAHVQRKLYVATKQHYQLKRERKKVAHG